MVETHRKVRRVHLVGEGGLQRLRRTRGADDGQVRAGHERRREEGETLDVVEVRMGDQEMRLQRLRLLETASELGDARAGVDDDEVVVLVEPRGTSCCRRTAASSCLA